MDSIPLLEPRGISSVAPLLNILKISIPPMCSADRTANDVSFFLMPCERRAVNSQDVENTIKVPPHTLYLYRYTSAKPFPSVLNPPTATLSLWTASVFTFVMNCVCATGIDSILQSSALPSVDRVCREITPSRVHVTTVAGSRKALSVCSERTQNT